MNSKYWRYLFFADLLAELTAIAGRWNTVQLFTKPLLMVFLFTWFMVSSAKLLPLRYCIAAALLFSWAGDVFLMLEPGGKGWFMAGLGSFLLAHLMYIVFFLRARRATSLGRPLKPFVVVWVALYVLLLYGLLYKHIGNLKIPVGVYAGTIGAMLVASFHAFDKSRPGAAGYCIAGALCFVVSDSLLAINKFYLSFQAAGICIMLSYGMAQFAITKGSLLYLATGKKDGRLKN